MIEPFTDMERKGKLRHRIDLLTTDPSGKQEINKVGVIEDGYGFTHLVCKCNKWGTKNWCEHVERVHLKDHYMNGAIDTYKPYIEPAPAIVVFRQPVWLIVPTVVIPTGNGYSRVIVLWGGPPQRTASTSTYESNGGETIGLITEDGRRHAIRKLILEWLPALTVRGLKCTDKVHKPGSSPLDLSTPYSSMDEDSKKLALTDCFSILDSEQCASCYVAAHVPF